MEKICAFDVASEESEAYVDGVRRRVRMRPRCLAGFLRELEPGTAVVMESTGKYHEMIAKVAFRLGYAVYVLNPRDTAAYRAWSGRRVKTDPLDARMVHEYTSLRLDRLRRYVPKTARMGLVEELLRIRNLLVESRTAIQQSLKATSGALRHMLGDPCSELSAKIDRCEELLEELLKDEEGFARLKQAPGFRTIGAAAMLCAYTRGEFKDASSFVAYLGLDLYVSKSGKWEGRCRLTKRGRSLWRKILYLCASGCSHSHAYSGYYFNLIEHNLEWRSAMVALSRKLAKTAWSMLRHGTSFDPLRVHLEAHRITA